MPASPDVGDGAAIRAVAVTFAVNGIAFPSLLPRFPQLAEQVGASEAAFGLALLGGGVGGLVGGLGAPLLARRVGLVRATTACGVLLLAAVTLVGLAPTIPLLAAALALAGLGDASHDISMNEIALGEQARRTGSVMGRLHGLWSAGATAATSLGAGAAALDVPVALHLGVVAAAALAVQLLVAGRLRDRGGPPVDARSLPQGGQDRSPTGMGAAVHVAPSPSLSGAEPVGVRLRRGPARRVGGRARPRGGPGRPRRWPVLLGLAVATLGAILAEGTGLDWSALALRRGLDATPGVAGLGPVVFSAGILAGRAVTDPLVDRLGAGRLLVVGDAAAAVAMAVGLLAAAGSGSPWPLLVGLAVTGVGVAPNFPMLFGAGDRVVERLRLPAGTGSSLVGTLPRLCGLVLPAGIGVLAEAAGLLAALGGVVVGAVLVAWLLPRLVTVPQQDPAASTANL